MMLKTRRYFYAALLMLLSTAGSGNASAQQAMAVTDGDTLEVRFRVGQSDIDPAYSNNQQRVDEFVRRINYRYAHVPGDLLKLDIFTGASPEGPSELNRRLGEQRGLALRKLLTEKLNGRIRNITVVNQGARWGALFKMIEESDEPWKYEVLNVLGKRPEGDDWKVDPREQQLRKLHGGAVWQRLNSRYLPILRSSGSAVVAQITPQERDTIVIRDTVYYLPEPCPQYEPPIDHSKKLAVKTNLLLWGVVAPNVQVELPLGQTNRWSIEGEVFAPWWTWSHNAHAEQFLNLGVELRYWLGNRQKHHTLDGWHLGGGLAGGYYDFEWKRSEGYQGEYLNLYCNLGYQHRFGRHNQWAVDGGIALGWIPTKYRHYLGSSQFPVGHEEEYDDHLMWQDTQWKHLLGATHVNVSLVYFLDWKWFNKKQNAKEQTR